MAASNIVDVEFMKNQETSFHIDHAHVHSITAGDLQFHGNMDDGGGDFGGKSHTSKKEQTHTFTNFPNPDSESEEEDKANLLSGERKQPSFWTFEYYQQFFDVDTNQVLGRILGSMLPNPKANYLQSKIRPNPDLYGPFWICTTLVFTTAIAGNMANYLQNWQDYNWKYDFHKVTFAATAIFAYWWVVPSLLWLLLWWRGNHAGLVFLEIICVYGYSLAIYIPISVLWVIQVSWLQWLLVMIGMVLSGSVLVLTFWPVVREESKQIAFIGMLGIIVLHGALAVGFVLYFFHVPYEPEIEESPLNNTSLADTTIASVNHIVKSTAEEVAKQFINETSPS